MLVLTKKTAEAIVIGDSIRVTVVSIGNGKVRLGIDAPKQVLVDRQEVQNNREAADAPAMRIAQIFPA
jgi:carbon storage regulator